MPTVDEAGLPGLHTSVWHGIWLPKGTPRDVVMKLNAAIVETLADPAVRAAIRRSRPGNPAARAADAGSAVRPPQGGDRQVVADDQGGRAQGRMITAA